jgi:hypothetical protein
VEWTDVKSHDCKKKQEANMQCDPADMHGRIDAF